MAVSFFNHDCKEQDMMKSLILLCVLLVPVNLVLANEDRFSFLLASSFDSEKHALADYYLSEKLDGVRAYWDGAGRQTFDEVSGIVRRSEANDGWRKIKFMVFELPTAEGDFTMRYQKMLQLYEQEAAPNWGVVEQLEPPTSIKELNSMLVKLDGLGGEGLMLKSKAAPYRGGRSDDLLKIKLKNDAQAKVIAHHKGRGRLANVMGSMTVEMPTGIRFKIGSGFSDSERMTPPGIGSYVTYKYNGLTKNGKPRFPVFWRVRRDE